MLKQTVTYDDFNGNPRTEVLYFNLTRMEIMDLIDLQPRLEAWKKRTSGSAEMRDLEVTEIKELLDIVKLLVREAYGERSEDGRHFRKSKEVAEGFLYSAAYDAFVYGLFEDPNNAVRFMVGVMPQGIGEGPEQEKGVLTLENVKLPSMTAVVEEVPAWKRENRNPTSAELRSMTPEQLQEAFRTRAGS